MVSMNCFVLFTMLLSVWSFHTEAVTSKEMGSYSLEQKINVVEAYREFFREYKIKLSASHQSEFLKHLSFISEAYASGDFNCFYAGWPSKTVNGKCTNPARTNTSYVSEASGASCSSAQLMCNPILFGRPGICVNTSTQVLRNSAYSQCERNFATQGRTIASVAQALGEGDLPGQADEMHRLADEICATGFQTGSRMCQNLKNKLLALKNETPRESNQAAPAHASRNDAPAAAAAIPRNEVRPETEAPIAAETETNDENLRQVATQADRLTTTVENASNADCPPEEQIIVTPTPITTLNPLSARVEAAAYPFQNRVQCDHAPQTSPDSPEAISQFIRENNITLSPGPEIAQTQDFRNFMFEFNKFPASLMRELKSKGARITAHIGNGVTEAKGYQNSESRTFDGRAWSKVQGAGGSVSPGVIHNPTVIVINNIYNNTYGSAHSHGSSNLFLHEHAHALDTLYGKNSISNSVTFQNLLKEETTKAYMNKIFGPYEQSRSDETFAEFFAYYNSCSAAAEQMRSEAPEMASFLQNLTSVNELLQRERAAAQAAARIRARR